MNVRELRIGNIVDYGNYKECHITHWPDLRDECVCFYSPIPLTEDWLVRFGFEKIKEVDGQDVWCLPGEENDFNRFDLYQTELGFELPSGSFCKTVHVLQNYYYFHYVCEKELTIKNKEK